MAGEAHLDVVDATVRFGDTVALDAVSLSVRRGEIVALLGPSGCGKSTLLRAIAGLQPLDSGGVLLDGNPIDRVAPHQRGMGLMSQRHSLFPHRTVAENVAFGLEMQGVDGPERRERVETMLESVGLAGYGHRSVDALSGGEAQRVALARTLAPRPALVMLDEPMGSLDRLLRERLAVDIRQTLRNQQVTAIVVTHDQDEAFTVADRAAVMHEGRIEQVAGPSELRRHPASPFVARFLGIDRFVDVVVDHDGEFTIAGLRLRRSDWPSGAGTAVVPPEAVTLGDDGERVTAVVGVQRFRGDHFHTDLRVGDVHLVATLPDAHPEGHELLIGLDATRLAHLGR